MLLTEKLGLIILASVILTLIGSMVATNTNPRYYRVRYTINFVLATVSAACGLSALIIFLIVA